MTITINITPCTAHSVHSVLFSLGSLALSSGFPCCSFRRNVWSSHSLRFLLFIRFSFIRCSNKLFFCFCLNNYWPLLMSKILWRLFRIKYVFSAHILLKLLPTASASALIYSNTTDKQLKHNLFCSYGENNERERKIFQLRNNKVGLLAAAIILELHRYLW